MTAWAYRLGSAGASLVGTVAVLRLSSVWGWLGWAACQGAAATIAQHLGEREAR